jgi:enoyl-CoA hydratase/carnithine racemase
VGSLKEKSGVREVILEFFSIEKQGSVAIIYWAHEDQNRFTTPFNEANIAALKELEADPSVTGVVITSKNEKFFSTGIFLEWMMAQGAKGYEFIKPFPHSLHELMITVTAFGKPLIAAINGHAVAMGCILAAMMDYRLMRDDKGLVRLPEVQIGIPFWPGMTAVFKDIMPAASFRDMALHGDKYTGKQALEMGYIDELVPPENLVSRAVELAAKLGQSNLETYATIKRVNRAGVLHIMKTEDPKTVEKFLEPFKAK